MSEVERDPEGAPLTVKLKHTYLMGHEAPFPVYVKRPSGLLRYATLACVFNLALVQQESGEVQAAKELLQAILRQYPSYTPAYARLAILLDVRHTKPHTTRVQTSRPSLHCRNAVQL